MNLQDFYSELPAVWLVFADSYLTHGNAPEASADIREKSLIDLFRSYVNAELDNPLKRKLYEESTCAHLNNILNLLKLWSEDLELIYHIRENKNPNSLVCQVAQRFLQRVRTFDDITVIPNGLISAEHTKANENICLAVLKRRNGYIDWIQINPGGLYHQHCPSLAGEKCNVYMEITEIDVNDITEDWLFLLVGLKGISPGDKFYYKEKSLYECLLAHLNGKTKFYSEPNQGFEYYSHSSPKHTWQVIGQTFYYMLRHFLRDAADVVYWRFVIGFKLHLMEKIFIAYQDKKNKQIQQCHYLLQEMCRQVAQLTLDYGDQEQKNSSVKLIADIKLCMSKCYIEQNQEISCASELKEPQISSLKFVSPNLINNNYSPSNSALHDLQVDQLFIKPEMQDNIIDYLKRFESDFIDKLVGSEKLKDVALLSYGIEAFFIDYLVNTDILKKSVNSFSKDDSYLAKAVLKLAETFYGCQGMFINHFLSNNIYQPQLFAKNVIVQFFAYATIAALNLRDKNIGLLLSDYNLCTSVSEILNLNQIVTHLVIHDCRYLKVLLNIQDFFTWEKNKEDVFSYKRFNCDSTVIITNTANDCNTDVIFASKLLQKYQTAYCSFILDYRDLEEEKMNQKWFKLAYTEKYLPSLYCLLSKMAYLAKSSLIGLPLHVNSTIFRCCWSNRYSRYWQTTAVFFINSKYEVRPKPNVNKFTSYAVASNCYQRIISYKANADMNLTHLSENKIIASQDEKPPTIDYNCYVHLGFLQSEPWLKFERLYIAIKDQQLDFSCEEEAILIKQTLFEVSIVKKNLGSLLEWSVHTNPYLIHKLGLLCIEKAMAMKYRLTQHPAISEILEVILGLLTFYPQEHKKNFIQNITDIFYMLKTAIDQTDTNLSENTLLHLNAYLIICVQAEPQLVKSDAFTILKALLSVNNYKIKGISLNNNLLRRMCMSYLSWNTLIEHQVEQCSNLLNDLMLTILPQWDNTSLWQKSEANLFTSGDYSVKPLLGVIYFQNQPVTGLPDTITEHRVFKEYLKKVSFVVIPGSHKMNNYEVPCYLSVDHKPHTRLTLVKDSLLIEELIDENFQLYLSPEELLGHAKYPALFFQLPNSEEIMTHWLDKTNILIKNQQRQIFYKWDLEKNTVYSLLHQGYLVPWDQLKTCYFKIWLEHIEIPDWIEIIASKPIDSLEISIVSLHFPRLSLDFNYRLGTFSSCQMHCYNLAKHQYLNVLEGFSNYLVLEKKDENLQKRLIKVIIPYRELKPHKVFYNKTTVIDLKKIRMPFNFVYDLDQITWLLKGNHIQAHLFLALIYYCSASLDDNDVSGCNAYHLARENLEICWKDQPYDDIELDILEQLLSRLTMRDYHSHRIALCLKVVSLLVHSLCLAFLYQESTVLHNKERNEILLKQCLKWLPHTVALYLQSKHTIFARIRLSGEEEEEIMKYCLNSLQQEQGRQPKISVDEVNEDELISCLTSFQAYFQLYFRNQSQVSMSKNSEKIYNKHYKQLFVKTGMTATPFLSLFNKHITKLSFFSDTEGLNFLDGIKAILLDRFRLMHFIVLYKLAKSSVIKISKYRYLLHHIVLRTSVNDDFPQVLVMMLVRSLLLVAEHPEKFPESPMWYDSCYISVELFERKLTVTKLYQELPSFCWIAPKIYDKYEEELRAKEIARNKDDMENKNIWSYLSRYDLDYQGIPLCLPDDPFSFTLEYESHINFSDWKKMYVVRQLYLQAARNNAMYNFFVSILQQCDKLKDTSAMGWTISPSTYNGITVTIMSDIMPESPTQEMVNLENKVLFEQPLIDLTTFFSVQQQIFENCDFLFEAQLKGPSNGYQKQFYTELKDSWVSHSKETIHSYYWVNAQAVEKLVTSLQVKYIEVEKEAKAIWKNISKQFEQKPNTEMDNYFALRYYSGQVSHYHKGDLLKLLVEPHKLIDFNPACVSKKDVIIKNISYYITNEINASKIVRVLTLIQQYKQVKNESERFSLVQILVKCLKENLDSVSYRYPHWLLFQLENNVIIRKNQQELIEAMLNQSEKVMYQLNMGEGKSSIILPLLSYNLANGHQLLRINVLSSLIITMKNFLFQRFSGLIRKHIYTLPFYRDTDISVENLKLILKTLKMCQLGQHILLVTPEHRLSLQLKVRELMIENQQQINATGIFNWQTYRQRTLCNSEIYEDLSEEQRLHLLAKQDHHLKICLLDEKYIDEENQIIKVPPRGQGRREFSRFKERIIDPTLREWSCLKAAYRELLYNSKLGCLDSSQKLTLLNNINKMLVVDLLDESDEILKHGTELNYTMGDKYVFSGGELRWQIPQFFIQTIFCDVSVRDIITAGKSDGFTVINLHYHPKGGVPFVQFCNESYYEKYVKPLLIEIFFREHLSTFRKFCIDVDVSLFEKEHSSLKNYVAGQLPLSTEKKILNFLDDKGTVKDTLLIAKGWLSHGILFHVFSAKYRVNYGLNIDLFCQYPKKIAIPFWGKDMPSPRSEFSHPDIMLGFTIISYLYQGLNQEQLKKTLLKLKNKFSCQVADSYLRSWTETSRVWIESLTDEFPPLLLTSFEHLDLCNEQCLAEVDKYLSGNHPAIFFYLNHFVFIEEAMQYLYKISANAHSLVGYNAVLGFSGTDDRKVTMPFQVKSLRSYTEQGTNGKMLYILTEKRNSHYFSLKTEDTHHLLQELCEYIKEQPDCHALIDAGALVMGLTNNDVASILINQLPNKFLGILYFSDEGNNLTVLTQDRKTVCLQDCYLDKQYLFAYLDDVHTRGTDIQLPLNCHAVLTIGMGMQKDKLMQAAMRLRQLAKKQSVSLWGTHVVTLAIARDNQIEVNMINSQEVIKWVTNNTITQINTDLFPVILRKINFQFLQKAETWLMEAPATIDTLIQNCQEKELYLLQEFYALSPQREDLGNRLYWIISTRIRTFWLDLEQELIKKKLIQTTFFEKVFNQLDKENFRSQLYTICSELAVYLQSAYVRHSFDNDEEREVEVEIIQEQQVVIKREKREACLEEKWDVKLILHENFIEIAEEQGIIVLINDIQHFVSLPVDIKNIVWHSKIYMTVNFVTSIKAESLDNYLRPVDVVLIHRVKDQSYVVLLSGLEASCIKSKCYQKLNSNILVHINDIDGPTTLPTGSAVSKQEHKLLTIIKLFSGQCQYSSSKEIKYISKRVGRIYPCYFTNSKVLIDNDCSQKLYGILIKEGFLDFAGIMTEKLLKLLSRVKADESPVFELIDYKLHKEHILKKLYGIYLKLIVKPSLLKNNHYTLWQWIGARGRLKEYHGSELESILDSECNLKC